VVGVKIELFWDRVDQSGECWLWLGSTTRGYGHLAIDGRTRMAHRVAYELANGPIPTGLVIDHLCRNHSCVRPDHLEPVTNYENVIVRGESPVARAVRTGLCKRGHPRLRGKGNCQQCERDRARRTREARWAREGRSSRSLATAAWWADRSVEDRERTGALISAVRRTR
jgi:hypothetical protein